MYNEETLFRDIRTRFKRNKFLTAKDFFRIIIWKAERQKGKIKEDNGGYIKARKKIEEVTGSLIKFNSREEKVKKVLELKRVDIPIASAILTVCFPNDFTVADRRTYKYFYEQRLFRRKTVTSKSESLENAVNDYLAYADKCKDLAKELGIELRELDMAIWALIGEGELIKFLKE